MMANTTLILVI